MISDLTKSVGLKTVWEYVNDIGELYKEELSMDNNEINYDRLYQRLHDIIKDIIMKSYETGMRTVPLIDKQSSNSIIIPSDKIIIP